MMDKSTVRKDTMDIFANFLVPAGASALISIATFALNIFLDRRTRFTVNPGFEWNLAPDAEGNIHRRKYYYDDIAFMKMFKQPQLYVEVTNHSKFDIFVETICYPTNHTETEKVYRHEFDHTQASSLKPGEARRFYAKDKDVREIINFAYCARVTTTGGQVRDFQSSALRRFE
jgi:hypothetical protein